MQINTPLCKMNGRDWSPEPGLSQALGLTFTKGLSLSLLEFSPNGAPPERKRNPGLCARAATAASRAALRPSARQRVHLRPGVRPQPRPVRNALPGAPATDGDTEARAVDWRPGSPATGLVHLVARPRALSPPRTTRRSLSSGVSAPGIGTLLLSPRDSWVLSSTLVKYQSTSAVQPARVLVTLFSPVLGIPPPPHRPRGKPPGLPSLADPPSAQASPIPQAAGRTEGWE